MKKLKTFESYGDTGYSNSKNLSPNIGQQVNDPINEKIKTIVDNITKTKVYFKMLRDTTSHVYLNLMEQYPRNSDVFIDNVINKDVILGELIEDVYDTISQSDTMKRLEDVIDMLEQIETYTGQGNIDRILSGEYIENYEDDDEGEESEIEDDED